MSAMLIAVLLLAGQLGQVRLALRAAGQRAAG